MKINVTRRDVFKFAGGAAAGVMLTPAPWQLVDDLAIWTQNWSWIPVPPKGERTTRLTACSLCPEGCAIEARCIGGLPVSVRAAAGSTGLCTLGLTGHHLAYHPARIAEPLRIMRSGPRVRTSKVALDEVIGKCARAVARARSGDGAVAVLDMRRGRSSSWAWQRLLAGVPQNRLVTPPGAEGSSLATLRNILGSSGDVAIDFEKVRTLVVFGAPIADGWGSPRLLQRIQSGAEDRIRLIDIEPARSHTAGIADRWIPARPGTEAVVALGLANVLLTEKLVSDEWIARAADHSQYASLVMRYDPATVERITGVPRGSIVAAARDIASGGPVAFVAGEQPGAGRLGGAAETAIFALNVLVGGNSLTLPAPLPPPADGEVVPAAELEAIPDRSLTLLVVDASTGDVPFPWALARRKLDPKRGLVVALSPFLAGTATHADYVVPTAAFLESVQEIPSGPGSPAPSLALSAAVLAPRVSALDPIAFIQRVAVAAGAPEPGFATSEEIIRARVRRIHEARQGAVVTFADGTVTQVSDLGSPDELWDQMIAGARWTGPTTAAEISRCNLLGVAPAPTTANEAEHRNVRPLHLEELERAGERVRPQLVVLPRSSRDVAATAAVSPVLTKLYAESRLRLGERTASINPKTARELGLSSGQTARLQTAGGTAVVTIAIDGKVMPSVVELTVGPDRAALGEAKETWRTRIIDLCAVDEQGNWHSAAARLVEA